MGILDELKQKADKARLEKEREEARLADLERAYREGIRPAMLKIHHFLLELTGLLTEPVLASFEFPGIGRVDRLEQKNYSILIDSQRDPKLITLRFDCVARDERRYSVSPKSAADEACQFLTENKVMYSDWALRDANRQVSGLMIQCKLRVPVELAFEADIGRGGIRVMSHNYGGAAEKDFLARYDDIDAEWLDKLGYYILRQDDSLGTLSLSEEERIRIRTLVEEKKRRESPPAGAPRKDEGRSGPKWLGLFGKPPR
jgi:hypothetical protein